MPEGPLGRKRPFVTTNLKYDVSVDMPQETWLTPAKATDVLSIRVNAPQQDVVEHVKKQLGQVLLAVNNLAHPSRYRVVAEEVEESERPGDTISSGDVRVTWTYILQGSGMGEFANTMTSSDAMWRLHEVVNRGNNEPIETSQARREFELGPDMEARIQITTE